MNAICSRAAALLAPPQARQALTASAPPRQPHGSLSRQLSVCCMALQPAAAQLQSAGAPAAAPQGAAAAVPALALARRAALGLGVLAALQPALQALADTTLPPPTLRPELTPDWSLYDAADQQLRDAAALLQQALNAESVEQEEALWTRIISDYGGLDANWVPDLVGRAYGNRGNARSRQGKLEAALADYNRAMELCPWSVDPVLNRGVVLEALGRFDEAITDYRAVLAVAPNDPAAWNNLGNASAGKGDWVTAADGFGKAAQLAPQFSFAAANRALALYQLGETNRATKDLRALLRRYPEFPDARAALAAALWEAGLQAEAEQEWGRVNDPRYRDRSWLRGERRWPPRLAAALEALLDIRGVRS